MVSIEAHVAWVAVPEVPPNVPHQRLGAARGAHNYLTQTYRNSRARALYGDPARCMWLLGDCHHGFQTGSYLRPFLVD